MIHLPKYSLKYVAENVNENLMTPVRTLQEIKDYFKEPSLRGKYLIEWSRDKKSNSYRLIPIVRLDGASSIDIVSGNESNGLGKHDDFEVLISNTAEKYENGKRFYDQDISKTVGHSPFRISSTPKGISKRLCTVGIDLAKVYDHAIINQTSIYEAITAVEGNNKFYSRFIPKKVKGFLKEGKQRTEKDLTGILELIQEPIVPEEIKMHLIVALENEGFDFKERRIVDEKDHKKLKDKVMGILRIYPIF